MPTYSTTTGTAPTNPRGTATDTFSVTGTGNKSGTLTWTLVGPVPVGSGGTCASAVWPTTPPVGSPTGTLTFTGDQTNTPVPTSGASVSGAGCYSWVDTLNGGTFPTPPGGVTHAAGTAGEVFQVQPLAPALTTTINPTVVGGVAKATDTIVVIGTNLGSGGGAPASAALTWSLLGPVAPISSSCTAVNWTAVGVPVADTGTITATGNNTYTATPTSPAGTDLTPGQCYGFTETLAATTDSSSAVSLASATNEFVQVASVPTYSTTTGTAPTNPRGTATDTFSVTGTGNKSGTLTWTLVGPVPVGRAGPAPRRCGRRRLLSGRPREPSPSPAIRPTPPCPPAGRR